MFNNFSGINVNGEDNIFLLFKGIDISFLLIFFLEFIIFLVGIKI